MERLKVLVTGIGGGGHGEQILKALKMAKTPYEIVGGDMLPFSKGLFEVDHPYILPSATDSIYMDTIIELCQKHNVQAVFHGSEPELKIFSEQRSLFDAHGLFVPINPKSIIELCMDKYKTMKWLKENDFNCPQTTKVTSLDDLERVDFLPVVIKPSIGGGGSVNTFIAQTEYELTTFTKYLLSIYPEFIVQEYIGTPESEYTVGVLIDMYGNFLNSIAVKRMILSGLSNKIKVPNITGNRKYGPILAISSGISQGQIGQFPEVTNTCERLALALGCRGAVNIQCRYVEEKVYVFEINPRFSGTTSLRAMVGYNEPDILIRKHVLGENVLPRFSYKTGFIMRGLTETYSETLDLLNNLASKGLGDIND